MRAATYRGCVPPCQRLYGDGRGLACRLYRDFSIGSSRLGLMMACVGVKVCRCIHWTGVMSTDFGGGLSGICAESTMVTLGGNVVGVSFGTLGEGAGQSGWKTTAGEGRGVFGITAVGGFSVILEMMRKIV